jgi:excisionase family DNA binding protein
MDRMSERALSDADVSAIARCVAETLGTRADDRPLLTVDEFAKRLGVAPRTAREMLLRRELPSYKVMGSRRVAPADLDAYLAAHRTRAQEEAA